MEKLLFRGYDLNKCSASVLSSLCYMMTYESNVAFFYIATSMGVITIFRMISKSTFNRLYKRYLSLNNYECAR